MGFASAVLLGIAAVLVLDTVGSVASLRFRFQYARLAPISYGLWTVSGLLAAHSAGADTSRAAIFGALAGGLVALTEATVGWWISWRLGPGQPTPAHATTALIRRVVVLVAVRGAALGAIGGIVRSFLAPA